MEDKNEMVEVHISTEPLITYYYDLIQGSPEWFAARLGIPTASMFRILITSKGKIANNKTVRNYALQLAAERETGIIEESYQGYDMLRGHFQEVIARNIYSENLDPVAECGFIVRDFGSFKVGGSPDGLVNLPNDDDGGIEIKSRLSKFQLETIINNKTPEEYIDQIQGSMFVSGRNWWDFVQYSNGMPLYIERFEPNIEWQKLIIEALLNLESMILEYQLAYKQNAKELIKTEQIEMRFDDTIVSSEVK